MKRTVPNLCHAAVIIKLELFCDCLSFLDYRGSFCAVCAALSEAVVFVVVRCVCHQALSCTVINMRHGTHLVSYSYDTYLWIYSRPDIITHSNSPSPPLTCYYIIFMAPSHM